MAFSKHPAWLYAVIGLILGVVLVAGYVYWNEQNPPVQQAYHIHADFAFFIGGQKLDFAQEKYMSTPENKLSKYVHLHDGKGNVIHFHAKNISLKIFFETIGYSFADGSMTIVQLDKPPARNGFVTTDENVLYANDAKSRWKVWVNGVENEEGFDYVPADLDRILISYGDETPDELQAQFAQVTDVACIQSEKCPERGKPDDESSCAGSGECETGEIPIGN